MADARRPCKACGRNRAERFFTSARGRTCADCRRSARNRSARDRRYRQTYGITLAEYEQMLAQQGGACAICGGRRGYNLAVDHDHNVERVHGNVRISVRGLLCKRCNKRLLPAAGDSQLVLGRAIAYLQRWPAREVLSNG